MQQRAGCFAIAIIRRTYILTQPFVRPEWQVNQHSLLQKVFLSSRHVHINSPQYTGAARCKSLEEALATSGDVVLEYRSPGHHRQLAERLRWFADWREGTPRGAYHGVMFAARNDSGGSSEKAAADSWKQTAAGVAARMVFLVPAANFGGELTQHAESTYVLRAREQLAWHPGESGSR